MCAEVGMSFPDWQVRSDCRLGHERMYNMYARNHLGPVGCWRSREVMSIASVRSLAGRTHLLQNPTV